MHTSFSVILQQVCLDLGHTRRRKKKAYKLLCLIVVLIFNSILSVDENHRATTVQKANKSYDTLRKKHLVLIVYVFLAITYHKLKM